MSYFKIAFESDTMDGLTALQGSAPGKGAGVATSTQSESMVAPPPVQEDTGSADATSRFMQPPPVMDGTGLSYSGDSVSQSPPPTMAEMAVADFGSEAGMPLPPPTAE